MAFRHLGGSPQKALPGDLLQVIHDFEARSPDELSLRKGDKIELIERDDDFGDGWYLGKHVGNGKSGLFPEVYTTTTPRDNNVSATTMITAVNLIIGSSNNLHPTSRTDRSEASIVGSVAATPSPLNTMPTSQKTASIPNATFPAKSTVPTQRSISMVQQIPDEESPVMNETLSVIDEHITDMHMPRGARQSQRRGTNDSGSEYSSHLDNRMSYIAGHETDEEERNLHTKKEVTMWTPSQVAEHLEDIGVEDRHCEIFKQQEITGEVLLAMDQASIFMKEFDLGLVGRRLRTWHKIKAFQDEVRGPKTPVNQQRHTVVGGGGDLLEDCTSERRIPSGSSITSTTLVNRPSSSLAPPQLDVPSPHHSPTIQQLQSQTRDATSTPGSFTFKSGFDSPSRPSAASIRDLNHSRRHSAVDFASVFGPSTPTEPDGAPSVHTNTTTSPHRKTPSLDRNWTMGSGPSHEPLGRPFSAVNAGSFTNTDRNTFDPSALKSTHEAITTRDIDYGYISGSEVDSKRSRNLLRKRDTVSANHSRQNSNQADNRRTSVVRSRRQSRFGSVDSIKDTVAAMTAPAAKVYHVNGIGIKSHFRNSSANETSRTDRETNELTSPTVTKLEYESKPNMKINTSSLGNSKSATNGSPKSATAPPKSTSKPRMGLRAISDAVTGNERAQVSSPTSVTSPIKEFATQSPARTGSTTPSGASQSLERESTDASSKGTSVAHTGLTPTNGTRRKSKKETSAYLRGLEQKSPHEQMEGCDYSGWMKKKSSKVMTTWKPRLFVLNGRRLSYYYSENDTHEKGLIDISSHRVLPADDDVLTGLHATVTGAKSSPVSPAIAHTPTKASKEAAALPESTLQKPNSDSMFIFKLVPPRSGFSNAVNFTKPTIHYFAVDNVAQGRLWMAALMKATIDRDDTKPIKTTYQQKTISLAKAKIMRHRPPALMNLDENGETLDEGPKSDEIGLNIHRVDFDKTAGSVEHKRTGSLGSKAAARPGGEEPNASSEEHFQAHDS